MPALHLLRPQPSDDLPDEHITKMISDGSRVEVVVPSAGNTSLMFTCERLIAVDSYSCTYRVYSAPSPAPSGVSHVQTRRQSTSPGATGQTHYGLRILYTSTDVGLSGPLANAWDFDQTGAIMEESKLLQGICGSHLVRFVTQGLVMGRPAMLISDTQACAKELLDRLGPASEQLAKVIMRDVVSAINLACVAACQMHRNLNWGNVMVVEDPLAKPLGIKFLLSGFAATTACMGANGQPAVCSKVAPFSRMAPEIDNGQSYTSKADVYALGMMVLELVSGSCPWTYLWEQAGDKAEEAGCEGPCKSREDWYRELKKKVKEELGKGGRYAHLSESVRLFLEPMLEGEVEKRIELGELCKHTWIPK